jgi:uncharacterized protein YndB with AHSA1/START domain
MTTPAGPHRSDTDRIEKQITLRAPVARVWKALTDSKEFGAWFRVNLDGQFKPGGRIRGNITYPGYEHLVMDVTVERMDRERLFSFRWHPAAIDATTTRSRRRSSSSASKRSTPAAARTAEHA